MLAAGELSDSASGTDWPTLLTAIGALIGAGAAVIAVIADGRRRRHQIGVDNMWRLIDRWDGLQTQRDDTAEALLSNWDQRDNLPESALELLDTFELLGYLVVRSKTLSLEDAWINFSGAAIQWWYVCRPGIEKFQQMDPTIYEDFTTLADQLMDLEAKRRGKPRASLTPTDEDLKNLPQGRWSLRRGLVSVGAGPGLG